MECAHGHGGWSVPARLPLSNHAANASSAPALAYVHPSILADPAAPYGRLYCVYRA
ncbi:hypothetical protein ACF1GT_01085 [Streptomyces sp. NPDC014636]|uniref:hypothetical protein n=1 Tax=Streptomyces sp. NPDC014636 TaxID=3364876 RepID=UPI0036FE5685